MKYTCNCFCNDYFQTFTLFINMQWLHQLSHSLNFYLLSKQYLSTNKFFYLNLMLFNSEQRFIHYPACCRKSSFLELVFLRLSHLIEDLLILREQAVRHKQMRIFSTAKPLFCLVTKHKNVFFILACLLQQRKFMWIEKTWRNYLIVVWLPCGINSVGL